VALKAFKPGPESATYHAQEAAMFDLLRGAPFTLQLIESFCDVHTGIPVLVTAPLCACTLQERIAMHAEGAALYSRDEALRWSLQLCTAVLDFMNRQVCHEDLSPRNILLTTVQGDVVVADPGVALKSRQYGIPSEQAMRHMSRTLAPEVTGGDRFDMRSDWFGVGACMCMLFMGSLAAPLGQDGVIGLELAEWVMQDCQAMTQLLPDESERAIVCEVLLGLLEPRPQDRMTPNLAINRLAWLVPSWPLPGGEGMRRVLLDCEDDDMGDNGVFKLSLESGFAKHSNRGRIPPGQGEAQDSHSSYPEKGELREHYPDALYAMEEAWWRTLKSGPPIPKPGEAGRQSSMEEDMFNPRNGPANLVGELATEHAKLGQIWWALQLFDSALELAQGYVALR
jgi:serine/threonine protein kinase